MSDLYFWSAIYFTISLCLILSCVTVGTLEDMTEYGFFDFRWNAVLFFFNILLAFPLLVFFHFSNLIVFLRKKIWGI